MFVLVHPAVPRKGINRAAVVAIHLSVNGDVVTRLLLQLTEEFLV